MRITIIYFLISIFFTSSHCMELDDAFKKMKIKDSHLGQDQLLHDIIYNDYSKDIRPLIFKHLYKSLIPQLFSHVHIPDQKILNFFNGEIFNANGLWVALYPLDHLDTILMITDCLTPHSKYLKINRKCYNLGNSNYCWNPIYSDIFAYLDADSYFHINIVFLKETSSKISIDKRLKYKLHTFLQIPKISWSDSGQFLLISSKTNYQIFNIAEKTIYKGIYPLSVQQQHCQVRWAADDKHLIFYSDSMLMIYDIITKKEETYLPPSYFLKFSGLSPNGTHALFQNISQLCLLDLNSRKTEYLKIHCNSFFPQGYCLMLSEDTFLKIMSDNSYLIWNKTLGTICKKTYQFDFPVVVDNLKKMVQSSISLAQWNEFKELEKIINYFKSLQSHTTTEEADAHFKQLLLLLALQEAKKDQVIFPLATKTSDVMGIIKDISPQVRDIFADTIIRRNYLIENKEKSKNKHKKKDKCITM